MSRSHKLIESVLEGRSPSGVVSEAMRIDLRNVPESVAGFVAQYSDPFHRVLGDATDAASDLSSFRKALAIFLAQEISGRKDRNVERAVLDLSEAIEAAGDALYEIDFKWQALERLRE